MEEHVNPYRVLQVRRDATSAEIRQSYRKLSLFFHPGRKRSRRNYNKFVVLSKSYETLINEQARQRYDEVVFAGDKNIVYGNILVGGKPLEQKLESPPSLTLPEYQLQSVDSDDQSSIAIHTLCLKNDHQSIIETNDLPAHVPPLVSCSSSDSSDASVKRSGPLRFMYEARDGEEFNDAYDVFEQELGSKLYERVHFDNADDAVAESDCDSSPGLLFGSTCEQNPKNKTILLTTTRISEGRKFTQTIKHDADREIKLITVKSEDLMSTSSWVEYESDEEVQKQCNDWNMCTMDSLDRLCVMGVWGVYFS